MKRIILGLSVIGIVAAVAIGATVALFNDTETSAGNILVAGTMDLKVDHLRQTYNDVDCNTCNLTLISNPSNIVVKRNGVSVTPYPAVFVGSLTPFFIHSAWTAQNDPDLVAAGAKWIWESDPTRQEDTTSDVTYTFEKTFEWYGPILSSDLWFGVGSDNSIKIWLNGTLIAENTMEFGYRQGNMLHIPGALVNSYIVQGTNVLTFEVKNWALLNPPGTPFNNPGGLIYKFFISGNCQDNYYKAHCQLWGEKDLTNEKFFSFDDVKPGDRGTNLISLHVYNNDAYACLITSDIVDVEETVVDPEITAGDNINSVVGELSQFIKVFAWVDDGNGVYEGETVITGPNASFNTAIGNISLVASNTQYIGFAWCAGTQSLSGNNILCDGSSMGDIAQTDILSASFTAYAEQQRNNENFSCASTTLLLN
ncbi:MAG: SipW-dependent-type signal peptide-containing protein [Patescibacteria group bacterium]|jgi:predicted ribosomally synthesized peptide with SipW-like signal peptide